MDEYKEVFISYGREPEISAFVSRLKNDLEQNGFTVWLDLHDIPVGSDWHGAIGGGLHQCRAILPVITKKYLSSTYCTKELYTADGDRKYIFPLMFEDVDFDTDQTAQGVKFTISGINWTMCRPDKDDYNTSISRLIQDMRNKGLGLGDYKGPEKKIHLGKTGGEAADVGPKETSKPVLVIPDVELIGGIATGPDGKVICTSGAKHCISIFQEKKKVKEFGTFGIMSDLEMVSPAGVVVTQDGEIVVASQYHLKRFTMEGKFIGKVGDLKAPDDNCTLQGPMGVAIGKDNRIYIVETSKHQVKIFNSDFTFHSSFSDANEDLGSGHLNNPMGVAVNSTGEVFVADLSNNVIQVFSPEGEFLFHFGKQGHTLGCIQAPMAVAVDAEDYVYVASGTCTISIFKIQDREAIFVKAFGSHGAEKGKFNAIRTMHFDKEGRLYVGEMTTNRIQVFQ